MAKLLKLNKHYRLIFIKVSLFFIMGSCSFVWSQNDTVFKIEHVRCISSERDIKNGLSLLDKFKKIVFGKELLSLIKPNFVLSIDSAHIFILDQKLQYPVILDLNKEEANIIERDSGYPSLVSACIDSKKNIYFSDSKENIIYKIPYGERKAEVFNSELSQPTGLTYIEKNREILVSETNKHRISVLDLKGNVKTHIGKRGKADFEFNFPTHLCTNSNSEILIVDALNFRVQILNDKYEFVSKFGEAGDASGYLASPKGISTDQYGHIYLVDALFHTVQIFDRNGIYLFNFGLKGNKDGEFMMPGGISIDSFNNIYLADTFNSRIQIFKISNGKSK